MASTVTLTNQELQKAIVIQQVADKKLKQKEAAAILQPSARQVKRLNGSLYTRLRKHILA